MITGVALASAGTLTITYHDGKAPRFPGEAEFRTQERDSVTVGFVQVTPSPVITVAGRGTPIPPWLIPLLGAALAAALAAVTALGIRILRTRPRRQFAQAADVVAVQHADPPRVAAVQTTGNEPTLVLRIEPDPGTTTRTLTR